MTTPRLAAIAGGIATAVALGTGELLGGLLPGAPSPVAAVGAVVIDLQPPGAKDLMVALFGQADKLAFELIIAAIAILLGGSLGLLALRWSAAPAIGFFVFAGLGFFAAARDPQVATVLAAVTLLLAVGAGLVAFGALLAAARRPAEVTRGPVPVNAPAASAGPDPAAASAGPDPAAASAAAASAPAASPGRRRFLALSGAALGVAVAGVLTGRYLVTARPPLRPGVAIPPPDEAVAPPGPGTAFAVAGLTPLIVPNDDFYRIDTRLTTPRLDADTWQLRVHGMVEREVILSYGDLAAMPLVERYVTIACVSNEVGGGLVGNAKWTGVRLDDVLGMAGVRPDATQIVGRAFDGWTAGFPTAHGGPDGREGLIAVLMNDEPLPPEHGYPARLIVPGLYGYVSATKWLTEIELTTLEAFDAYWVPLGWAKEAPIKTQSRIDVPRPGGRIPIGPTAIAGVAWAPDRGISAVEVSIDDGPWQAAVLSTPLSDDAWVQWRLDWNAPAGEHQLQVRATDGAGETQTDERRPPAPDGASGYHTITVTAG